MTTIFARASGGGRAAVAVLRVSGPASRSMLEALAGKVPPPRRAALRRLRDPISGEALDDALVLWFPGPNSYTGEDCAEFQVHGGLAVVEGLSGSLIGLGARPAEPGEFTRRAFQNQRLDLTGAEAVADLIDAETGLQRRQALEQMAGGLTRTAEMWRNQLVEVLALLEALVDFPDEDLPVALARRCRELLRGLLAAISAAAADLTGERVRVGLRVALVGPPNAGKSTLFNVLVGREAAIVSPAPGTTRDVVEAAIVVDGQRVILADMAGLHEGARDPVEVEGIRRAHLWSQSADLRLHVRPHGQTGPALSVQPGPPGADWVVRSKADLVDPNGGLADGHAVSGLTGLGIDRLRDAITTFARGSASGEPPIATRERHREIFRSASACVARAIDALDGGLPSELAAEDARLAARTLALLSGRIDAEDVLGRVFATFCIGK